MGRNPTLIVIAIVGLTVFFSGCVKEKTPSVPSATPNVEAPKQPFKLAKRPPLPTKSLVEPPQRLKPHRDLNQKTLRAIESEDPQLCRQLGVGANRCLIEVAGATKNQKVCNMVRGSYSDKHECLTTVAAAIPMQIPCASIKKSEQDKYDCYAVVAAAMRRLAPCEVIKDDLYRKYDCYTGVAATVNMQAPCEAIKEDLDKKYDCYIAVASNVGKSAPCEAIRDNLPRKFDCYKAVGIATKKKGICGLIKDQKKRDECLDKLKQSTVCDGIKESQKKLECLSKLASILKNVGPCYYIDDIRARTGCLKATGLFDKKKRIVG